MKQPLALALLALLGQAEPKNKDAPAVQEKPKPFLRSFQDASARNLKSDLELLVSEHQVFPVASDKAVTAAQALKRLREVVDKQSDAEARTALAKAPLAKTADGLQA